MTKKLVCNILLGDVTLDDIDETRTVALAQTAIQQGVGSLLYQVTRLPALHEHAARQSAKYALQRREMKMIQEGLNTADIPVIWLKGAALAETVYPYTQCREMLDLDLYARQDHMDSILSLFEQNGYSRYVSDDKLFQEHETATAHHITMVNKRNILFEIHWRLLKLEEFSPDESWPWNQVTTFDIDGNRFKSFTPEAHLLYLCAHALLHHSESELLLRHYLDIHYLVTVCNLDWSTIITQAAQLKWTYPVEQMLSRTQSMLETSIPADLIDQLRANRTLDEDMKLIMHLSNPATMKLRKLHAELRQYHWSRQVRIIFRILFPPPIYMRQHYGQHLLLLLYLRRIVSLLNLLLQAIMQRSRP